MGAKYCVPQREVSPQLEVFEALTMVEVRTKYNLMARAFQKSGYYFFSNKELKRVFDLSDEQVYFALSTFTSNQEVFRVSSIDFWCALVLSASGRSEEKIAFGFKIIDTNNDDFISFNDLMVLLICATRGVSRLKGFLSLPEKLLDGVATRAFQQHQQDLNAEGEISLKSLLEYLLTNESCRAYLSGLGAKLPPADTAAMVAKRANILRELAAIRHKMEDIICDLEETKKNVDISHERGGDVEYLRVDEAALLAPTTVTQTTATSIPPTSSQELSPLDNQPPVTCHTNICDQRPPDNSSSNVASTSVLIQSDLTPAPSLSIQDDFASIKFSLSKEHPVNKYYGYDDSWMAEIYNKPRAHKMSHGIGTHSEKASDGAESSHPNIYGPGFEEQLLKEWRKIPQDLDLCVHLDEYTLIAMFEQLNVDVSFPFARRCLKGLSQNQLGQYNFHAMLKWFRLHFVEKELERNPESNSNPRAQQWFSYVQGMKDSVASLKALYSNATSDIARQRKIAIGLTNAHEVNFAKKLADFRSISSKGTSQVQLRYHFNQGKDNSDDASLTSSVNKAALIKAVTGKAPPPPYKTKLRLLWQTNPFTNLSTRRPKESTRLKAFEEKGHSFIVLHDSEGFDANDLLDFKNLLQEREWVAAVKKYAAQQSETNGNVERSFMPMTSKSASFYAGGYGGLSTKSRSRSFDKNEGIEPDENHETKTDPRDTPPQEYSSVTWIAFDVRKDVDEAFAFILKEALHNFFEAIPLSLRAHWYTKVHTEICCCEPNEEELNGKKKKKRRSSAMDNLIALMLGKNQDESVWLSGRRIVLVAMYHEDDHFVALEKDLLERDLFFSRFVQFARLELDLDQSLREMFEFSMKFFHFEEKLFGPQEEELGEEGNNPLRFAKELRNRKKQLKDILDSISSLSREELQRHCRDFGRKDSGTNAELVARVKEIYIERLELVGIGELSHFGQETIRQVFERMKIDKYAMEDHSEETKSRAMSQKKMTKSVSSSLLSKGLSAGPVLEGGLSLWEFNRMLFDAGSKTLYDKEDHRKMMNEYALLGDRDGYCTIPALLAYYEKYGRLREDIVRWSEGSLDRLLSGKLSIDVNYDPEALYSLSTLLTPSTSHNLFVPQLQSLLSRIAALKDLKIEGELDNLTDLFKNLPWDTLRAMSVQDQVELCLKSPGGLATWLMQRLESWCDGEQGVLSVVRQTVTDFLKRKGAISTKEETPPANSHESSQPNTDEIRNDDILGKDGEETEDEAEQSKKMSTGDDDVVKQNWILFDNHFQQTFIDEVRSAITAAMDEQHAIWRTEDEEQAEIDREEDEKNALERIRQMNLANDPFFSPPDSKDTSAAEFARSKEDKDRENQRNKRDVDKVQARQKKQWEVMTQIRIDLAKKFVALDSLCAHKNDENASRSHSSTDKAPPVDVDAQHNVDSTSHSHDKQREITLNDNEDWSSLRESIVEDLLFLHSLRQVPGFSLSLDESVAMETQKAHLLDLLQDIHFLEHEHYERLGFHFLAMYDALRLFSSGIFSIGMGTRDLCVRGQLDYDIQREVDLQRNNMMSWLPIGQGEMIPVKEMEREKRLRFERRRVGALAALERERLRRQMTEADRERLRLQKLEAKRLEFEKEEKRFFDSAFSLLLASREKRKTSHELNILVKSFEKVCVLKEDRFPEDFGVFVARNNLACVLVEVYGLEHPLGEPAEFYLKDVVEHIIAQYHASIRTEKERILKQRQQGKQTVLAEFVNDTVGKQDIIENEQKTEEKIDVVVDMPIPNPMSTAAIIVNYLDLLQRNDNEIILRQSFPIKQFFSRCFDALTEKEQEKLQLGLVPEYRQIPIFTVTANPQMIVSSIMDEVAYFTKKKLQLQEEALIAEAAAEDDASSITKQDHDILDEESVGTLQTDSTRRRIRRKNLEKQRKSEEQRQKDNKIRAETARQRKYLYDLIQSDQITNIFAAKAGRDQNSDSSAPKWSSAEEQDMVRSASAEFSRMASEKLTR